MTNKYYGPMFFLNRGVSSSSCPTHQWWEIHHTSSCALAVFNAWRNRIAKSWIEALDSLPSNDESYPYVKILAVGTCCGRKSRSHIVARLRDFQDPNAWPARPVTAMILRFVYGVSLCSLFIGASRCSSYILYRDFIDRVTQRCQAKKVRVDDNRKR